MPTTHRSTPPDRAPARGLRLEVRQILSRGGLVAMATETVYGIAGRADRPEVLERLTALKGRDPDRTYTWHLASHAPLQAFRELPRMVERLTKRYWPGPLTLVLRGVPPGLELVARDGWVGLRLPAHESTRAMLDFCPFPVVMTSANSSGQPPLVEAPAVAETFDGRIDLVVDSGPARIGESSTVLRLGRGHFETLREGLISSDDLRRAAALSIGFVCTGNTCRSPLAEGLARAAIGERLGAPPERIEEFGFAVRSAGVHAGVGSPVSDQVLDILSAEGIDLSKHVSRPASPENLGVLDRIYGLTRSHVEALQAILPPSKARAVELLDPDGVDVPDPIGGTIEDYRASAERIRVAIRSRVDEWV
jgi:tRNA threonylcarbamoyl adenosine modification protein (Sua5/YciO/YrdC/YwlC family)